MPRRTRTNRTAVVKRDSESQRAGEFHKGEFSRPLKVPASFLFFAAQLSVALRRARHLMLMAPIENVTASEIETSPA